jgi:hypothetical protein
MSNLFNDIFSNLDEMDMRPTRGQVSTQREEFVGFKDCTASGPISACGGGFFKKDKDSNRRMTNSVGSALRNATQPDGPAASPTRTGIDAPGELRKAVGEVLELLVTPAQQQNETRLDEILSLLENHRIDNDRNIDQLTRQLAQLTLKLHEKTKIAINKLDRRIDETNALAEITRAQDQERLTARLTGLATATDSKFHAVSISIDTRIAMLSARLNGDVNKTITDLGQAIASFGNSVSVREH